MKLRNIFGIYNSDRHKIIEILGIKFKFNFTKGFKYRTKKSLDTYKKKLSIAEKDIAILKKRIEKQHNSLLEQRRMNARLEERIIFLEMNIIRDSGLWDAKYYIDKYYPDIDKQLALYRYAKQGFEQKQSPSEIFNSEKYSTKCRGNQIIDFITRGRYEYSRLFWTNPFPVSEEDINEYLEVKKSRTSKKVMYMCITGDFDKLEEIKGFKYIDKDWDYICFTDNEEHIRLGQVGMWQVKPLIYKESTLSKNNRWHKIHPHLLFPEYDESIYIDSNINVLTPKLFEMVKNTDKDILLPMHANKINLYSEIIWARNNGYDEPELSEKLYKIIEESGFPQNYGMFENNIIYRKHHKPEIIDIMNEWWYFMQNYSNRDQTSFSYIFWKHNRKIEDYAFENTRIDYKNYCVFQHPNER